MGHRSAALAGLSMVVGLVVGAGAAVAQRGASPPRPELELDARAAARTASVRGPRRVAGYRGYRGLRGAAGPRGRTGAAGPNAAPGPPGAAGRAPVGRQTVTVNWQNDREGGRESSGFDVPGIGRGEVLCRRDAQQLIVRPTDQQADTVMYATRVQQTQAGSTEVVVRAARREFNTGPQFNEGLNRFGGEQRSTGSLSGILSGRNDRSGPGGPGPSPTTFRLSWHWVFDDGNPRCFVAGQFTSGG